MMRALLLALSLVAAGCAQSHQRSDGADAASIGSDAGAIDGASDSGARPDGGRDGGPGLSCGPNRCRTGEICCSERCGVCAFPDECVDFGCAGDE